MRLTLTSGHRRKVKRQGQHLAVWQCVCKPASRSGNELCFASARGWRAGVVATEPDDKFVGFRLVTLDCNAMGIVVHSSYPLLERISGALLPPTLRLALFRDCLCWRGQCQRRIGIVPTFAAHIFD
jgi:hypothetical protein